MSKTETENLTPWTASELAYRDQLVLAAIQGDWASQSQELGEFTESAVARFANGTRAKDYFIFAEAVLLERRRHGLAENKRTSIIWDNIPGGGSVVQPLAGYGITDKQPAASSRDPRLFSKEEIAGMPPENTAVKPKDPRLQDGRNLDLNTLNTMNTEPQKLFTADEILKAWKIHQNEANARVRENAAFTSIAAIRSRADRDLCDAEKAITKMDAFAAALDEASDFLTDFLSPNEP